MSASQRVSRGFHRLGVFIATAAFLLAGAVLAFFFSHSIELRYQAVRRAHDNAMGIEPVGPLTSQVFGLPEDSMKINLKQIGCYQEGAPMTYTYGEARDPDPFLAAIQPVVPPLEVLLVVSLAIYGIVRVIGWIIGGFMAS